MLQYYLQHHLPYMLSKHHWGMAVLLCFDCVLCAMQDAVGFNITEDECLVNSH